jgi:hypothetical protein
VLTEGVDAVAGNSSSPEEMRSVPTNAVCGTAPFCSGNLNLKPTVSRLPWEPPPSIWNRLRGSTKGEPDWSGRSVVNGGSSVETPSRATDPTSAEQEVSPSMLGVLRA